MTAFRNVVTACIVLSVGIGSNALAEEGPRAAAAKAALVDTIQMVTADKLDEWIPKYCDPKVCSNPMAIAEYKRFQLQSVKTFGGMCLQGENKDSIEVARWKDDPETSPVSTFYIKCEGRQLAVPITVRFDGDKVWLKKMSI